MATELRLPDLGEGIEDVTISAWRRMARRTTSLSWSMSVTASTSAIVLAFLRFSLSPAIRRTSVK